MHTFSAVAALAGLAALAACGPRQVEATPPTVTYAYEGEFGYDDIHRRADRHCLDEYGRRAVLVDRYPVSGGYEATFACE